MGKTGVAFEEIKSELMQDNDFKEEYEKLQARYDIINQIIQARKEQKMTQEELAKKIGTQKSNISRLESGNYNPTIELLSKVAEALGKELKIQII